MNKQRKEQIERLSREIKELEKQENSLHRQTIKLAAQNKETATLAKQAKLADGLYQAASELIEWRIEERKQTIEARTSEIHRRVTNKPEEYMGVEIQSDYTLGVKNALRRNPRPRNLKCRGKRGSCFCFYCRVKSGLGYRSTFSYGYALRSSGYRPSKKLD